MATVKYTGARYITKFANPIEWQANTAYEQIVAVQYQNKSYISKMPVPKTVGNPADNPSYWLLWAEPNAQFEELRQIVEEYDERINDNAQAIVNTNNEINHTRYIAVIGDSWSNQTTEWPTLLCNDMKYELINYSVAGAGYIAEGNTPGEGRQFINQLADLKNNSNLKYVDYLIVYGGVNDWRNIHATAQDMATAMINFMNSFNEIEKAYKPKIIVAFNVGYPTQEENNGFLQWISDVCTRLRRAGVNGICDTSIYWPCGFTKTQFYDTDLLHPTKALGEVVIKSYMSQLLNGTYDGVHFVRKCAIDTTTIQDTSKLDVDFSFDNGIISISMKSIEGFAINNPSHSAWRRIAFFGECGLFFGTVNPLEGNAYIESNGLNWWTSDVNNNTVKMCMPKFMFNAEIATLFFRLNGYNTSYNWSDIPLDTSGSNWVFNYPGGLSQTWSGKPIH